VGAFLNVHEGPQGIGYRRIENETVRQYLSMTYCAYWSERAFVVIAKGFVVGMTTSNEPGYYEEGAFGIRIENICTTVKKDTPNRFGRRDYLGFETISLVIILDLTEHNMT
jgi:Xaa-Pro aminopeptidase